jgi:hypothetical protein
MRQPAGLGPDAGGDGIEVALLAETLADALLNAPEDDVIAN